MQPERGALPSRHRRRAASRLDGRTVHAKRAWRLRLIFVTELGGKDAVSELQMQQIVVAAELQAAADQSRAAFLRGDAGVDELGVVRMQGAANRALRALKLDQQKAPPVRSLHDYLAFRAREKAADGLTGAQTGTDGPNDAPSDGRPGPGPA